MIMEMKCFRMGMSDISIKDNEESCIEQGYWYSVIPDSTYATVRVHEFSFLNHNIYFILLTTHLSNLITNYSFVSRSDVSITVSHNIV